MLSLIHIYIIVEMWLANHKRTINQVSLKRDIVAEYLEKQPDKVEKLSLIHI